MRILYSHRIQSRDGQSVHVEELVAALRSLGHEVLVVGPGFYDQARFGGESRLVPWIRARLPAAVGELAELAYNIPAWWRLRAALPAVPAGPDLRALQSVLPRRHLAGAPQPHAPSSSRSTRRWPMSAPASAGWGCRGWPGALERYAWRSAARVLAVTGVLRDTIAAAGVPRDRIEVVPNGIDPAKFAALPAREAATGRWCWASSASSATGTGWMR